MTVASIFASPGKWLNPQSTQPFAESPIVQNQPITQNRTPASSKPSRMTVASIDRNHLAPSYFPRSAEPDFSQAIPPVPSTDQPNLALGSIPVNHPVAFGGQNPSSHSQNQPQKKDSVSETPISPSIPLIGNATTPHPVSNPASQHQNPSSSISPASAPQQLQAVSEPGVVHITWNAVSGSGVTYTIERSNAFSGPFSPIVSDLKETQYADSTVTNGVEYFYRVRSQNAAGGAESEIVSATPASLPSTPTLTLIASNGSASLSWTASTGTGAITYSVERSLTSGSGYTVVTTGLSTPVFSDSSVTDGTTYYYRVKARNFVGDSDYSTEVPATPISSFLLGTATAGKTSVALTWNSATGAAQYDVTYGTTSGTYTSTLSNQTSPTTITGLTAGTQYFFSVKASNPENGLTLSTNELSAIPLGTFSITSLAASNLDQLKLSWGSSTGATSYDVQCGTSSGSYSITLTNQTSPTTLSGLSSGTNYYCVVVAKNSSGSITSGEASTSTYSPLTYTWPFDAGTESLYTFDPSKLELVGGVSRLRSLTQTDASYVGGDFKNAILNGLKWDSVNSKLVLDPDTSTGELSSTWTPRYDRILAYWKLNGTTGSSIAQSDTIRANNGPDGIAQNANGTGMKFVDAKQRQGVQFDGTDDFIRMRSSSSLTPSSAVTFSAWVNPQTLGAMNFIGGYGSTGYLGYWLACGSSSCTFSIGTGAAPTHQLASPAAIPLNQWSHVVGTYDGTTQRIYINGALVASTALSGAIQYGSLADGFLIGNTEGLTAGRFWKGNLDELAVWDTALSAQEIKLLYERQNARFSGSILSRVFDAGGVTSWPGISYKTQAPYGKELPNNQAPTASVPLMNSIVGLWHLNETTGTTPQDSSGLGNHSTLVGGSILNSDGVFGSGINFNGTNAMLTVPNNAALQLTTGTLSAWVKTAAPGSGYRAIASKELAYALFLVDGVLSIYDWGGSGLRSTGINLADDTWHHVALVFQSGVANQTFIYVDGVKVMTTSLTVSNQTRGFVIANSGAQAQNLKGNIDEVAVWSRTLSAAEIQEVYQRPLTRVKLQARSCSSSDCSDDLDQTNWRGFAGTNTSYFSETNNPSAADPSFLFTNFGFNLTNRQYFQYRAVLESDNASLSPDLKSVSAGPARFDGSNPIIVPVNGPKFQLYTGFTVNLGASCAGVPKFQLSHDKKTWYYYSTGMWDTTTAGITQASDASTINSNISSFGAVAGTGELYVKIFYPSDTSSPCEIDSISVAGADTSSTASSNPNAFAFTSVSAANGQVSLSWSSASGATSYRVCYGTSKAIVLACGTYVDLTGTSTTINSLTNDTLYYFRLIATNASGITTAPLQVTATPMAAPNVPTTLTATSGLFSTQLNWIAPSGSNLTYTIKRGTVSGGPYSTLATGVSSTAYTDLTALAGSSYYYVVSATNGGGTSGNSNEASGTALGSFSITSSGPGGGAAILTWSAALGATSYSVSYGVSSGVYTTTVNNQTSPATITGLTAGTTYYLLVIAKNGAGASSASQEVKVVPNQAMSFDWPFTTGTDASYTFNSTQIELFANACRLKPTSWTDNDNIAAGFGGGTLYGLVWDSGNQQLTLDSTLSQQALHSGWFPKFANVAHYWKLDGTYGASIADGASLNDSVGSCHLTAYNANGTGFGFIKGSVSTAVTFDGIDDSLSCSGGWNPGSANFSVSYWFKAPPGYVGRPLGKRDTTGYGSFFATLISGGRLQFELDESNAGNYVLLTGTRSIDDNAWHQATFVRNGTTLSIYVDGKLDKNTTLAGTLNISNTAPYEINRFAAASTIYPSIKLDDVAVWNTALNSEDVKTIYNHQQKAYSGTFLSRVFNAGQNVPWSGFSWATSRPYGKELPSNSANDSTSSYPQAASSLSNGLIGLWHFNEMATGTAPGGKDLKDDSGHGLHAWVGPSSSVVFGQSGKLNQALAYSIDAHTRFDVPANTFSGGTATLSFWMNWKGGDEVMPVGFDAYGLYIKGSSIGFNTANGDIYGFSNANLLKRWAHVVLEFHENDYTLNKIYIDGVSQSLSQIQGAPASGNAHLSDFFYLGGWALNSLYHFNDGTLFDEVAVWNRALSGTEIGQLYQRGDHTVKFQIRTCSMNDCSDDSSGANWKGPDGTANTYFSELNNMTASTVNATAPSMNFETLGVSVSTSQYIQYRVTLESDADPAIFTPDLKRVTVGPVYDSSAPAIYTINGSAFLTLSGFTVTLGSAGCSDTPRFQLSKDKTNWYYHNGTTWVTAANSYTQANPANTINSSISSLPGVIGTGTIYVRAYLNSNGARGCEIDNINITGSK